VFVVDDDFVVVVIYCWYVEMLFGFVVVGEVY